MYAPHITCLFVQGMTNQIELKQQVLADLGQLIEELNDEKAQILKACAQFGLFLKENSIIPYNDAMTAYLDFMIKLEKEKAVLESVGALTDFSTIGSFTWLLPRRILILSLCP